MRFRLSSIATMLGVKDGVGARETVTGGGKAMEEEREAIFSEIVSDSFVV
ncbi:hypothetical protein NUF46_001657 [Yersinia enterocolitica]|nr:hypothetical protein [Yersinia enterocolitica]